MPETIDPRFRNLDAWTTREAAAAIWEGQLAAVAAVGPAVPLVARAVDEAALRLAQGSGRLVYAGAGTSARIAVQDGSELAPTFDWPEERVLFLVAGGFEAMVSAVEGAEDDADAARRRVSEAGLGPSDVLIGLAASGRTPFTLAALQAAHAAGAYTIGISSNPSAALLSTCDAPILVETGPEVVAGSTRMKAGTAQKVVLNMISTALMIRLGRVYRGLMVDMRPLNDKLRARAVDMVARLAACPPEEAEKALAATGWSIKPAVLVAGGVTAEEAARRLEECGGNLRTALGDLA